MNMTQMKRKVALAAILSVAATPVLPAENRVCLRFDQLQQLQALDSGSAMATTNRQAFRVTFRGSCSAKASAAYFIVERDRLGPCLDHGDRLEVSEPAAPCVVDNVTLLPAVEVKFGRPVQ